MLGTCLFMKGNVVLLRPKMAPDRRQQQTTPDTDDPDPPWPYGAGFYVGGGATPERTARFQFFL